MRSLKLAGNKYISCRSISPAKVILIFAGLSCVELYGILQNSRVFCNKRGILWGNYVYQRSPIFFTSFQQSQSAGKLSFGGNSAVFFKSVSGDITPLMLFFSAAATRHPIVVVLHVLNFQKFRTNGGKNNGWRSSKKH